LSFIAFGWALAFAFVQTPLLNESPLRAVVAMKFGRNLPRNQVPDWASSYIDYKGLKKLIKAAAKSEDEGKQGGESPDLAGMVLDLVRG
jgi:hypothetical protein